LWKLSCRKNFEIDKVNAIAKAIKSGQTNPLKPLEDTKKIVMTAFVSQSELSRLRKKYVENGKYVTVHKVLYAILAGEVNDHVRYHQM